MKTVLWLVLVAGLVAAGGCARVGGRDLLAVGTVAPDFTALRADNTPVKLSDYRGKFVLVDFWATWCGPCKVSMPYMESLHTKLQAQGLVVLGVCVWDDRVKFDGWMKKPEVPTSYLKVVDPEGLTPKNIASSLYQVSGIPAFYLVGPDGKIAFAGMGAGPGTEAGLNDALRAAGMKL